MRSEGLFRLSGIPFPNIDPIAFQIGPLAIRWYALAYIGRKSCLAGGIACAWPSAATCARMPRTSMISWSGAVLGIILGGRFGYVVFYKCCLLRTEPN
ncbi:prolipoprotein diacylglyceryl transferase family protein [Nitratireductor sp. L15S-10]|uniref:prolipoprotein diacylglyceryl transferase family protein n=1 Tax=Nitratireductor sp. L15S-10 TaxID=3034028 RepID=UPI00385735F8